MNSIHDVGGMDGFGPVEREENEALFHEPWEARMRAINTIIFSKLGIFNRDESRYAIERMDPVYYLGSSYNQIWLLRTEALLIEKGVLTEKEIQEKEIQISPVSHMSHLQPYRKLLPVISSSQRKFVIPTTTGIEQVNEQIQPKFTPGMLVKVKNVSPLGHNRIPRYVRGKEGVIVRVHGNFILPDVKVHEGKDLYQPVYWVRFKAQDLWGEDAAPKDSLFIEMWEDYLELGGVENEKSRRSSPSS